MSVPKLISDAAEEMLEGAKSGKMTVYGAKFSDGTFAKSKYTKTQIALFKGEVIEGTDEEVLSRYVSPEGKYLPKLAQTTAA